MELQSVQNSQLAVSLEHEQTITDNLRKELQIEHSRCEALLSQEQAKLLELQRSLDAEKNRSLELLNSLNHERVLTEQLSMRMKEGASCQHRESLLEQAFVRELQAQLEEERSRTMELAAVIEKTHQKAIRSKRQLEAEVQMCCEETQKEREVSGKLRAMLESLQGQKQEVSHSLEAQKEREAKLKADWEQPQSPFKTMKEQDKNKKEERERERRQQQPTELEKQKDWQRDQERLVRMPYIEIATNWNKPCGLCSLIETFPSLRQSVLKNALDELFLHFSNAAVFRGLCLGLSLPEPDPVFMSLPMLGIAGCYQAEKSMA